LTKDKGWRFTEIPAARLEASAVAERWSASTTGGSSTLLTGGEADRSSVLSALSSRSGFGLIYFATHGIADPVNPMDGSFLALKGGHLYARDIKKLGMLGAPLVVMSACQTGLGKVFESGVFGLARAWWAAGAPQVVMSLWNIDDSATHDLMVDFMERLVADRPDADERTSKQHAEEALRSAMLKARERNPDPALWAGFALFGLPTAAASSRSPRLPTAPGGT
jgi:CHAT domain-containing protein